MKQHNASQNLSDKWVNNLCSAKKNKHIQESHKQRILFLFSFFIFCIGAPKPTVSISIIKVNKNYSFALSKR